MERLNFEELMRMVNKKIESQPLTLLYEKTNEPFHFKMKEELDFRGRPIDKSNYWLRNARKYAIIYATIFNNKLHTGEAEKYNVTDSEVQSNFNKFIYLLELFESFTHLDEFTHHIYDAARDVLRLEQQEHEQWKSKIFLRRILDKESTRGNQLRELSSVSNKLREVNNKCHIILDDVRHERISGAELDMVYPHLNEALDFYKEKLQATKARYKKFSDSYEQRKRKHLKASFSSQDLYSAVKVDFPTLRHSNTSVLTFQIRMYCSWYNKRFSEYFPTQQQKRNTKRKSDRVIKKNNRLAEKHQLTCEIIRLSNAGYSQRKIASQLKTSKSTVQRTLAKR